MGSTLGGVFLVLTALARPAMPQDTSPASPASPARTASATPIRDSLDRIVEEVVLAHAKPCRRAERQGVPCFPVSVEQEGPRFSVAEALRSYRAGSSPSPNRPPTVAETAPFLSGAPLSAFGSLPPIDPVCTTKNLLKKLSGKNTTYYLYRTWDERGERPLLTDRPLDPKAYASNPSFRYEHVGTYDGECEAVAAWRKALRAATQPKPVPDEEWRKP